MESLIEILIRLLMLLLGLFPVSVSSQPASIPTVIYPGDASSEAFMKTYTNISEVELTVMESLPPQVELHIKGEQPDGCELPVQVTQQRDGNTVIVEIFREVPADMICPMMLQPYEGTIRLEGTFQPGNYTFKINDYTVEREL
ncbi:MAG: hypothetical protein K8L99_11590 [Anaerolineae bacterium]|nr:hypothetical protein [Anaerolineae bacterium]